MKTISNNNIVVDNNTGLEWQQTIPSGTYTWDDAMNYCDDLVYAGYRDWRLPTRKELLSIVDNSRWYPAVDTTYFAYSSNYSDNFWTSEQYVGYALAAWDINFYLGSSTGNIKTEKQFVRCVRGNELHESTFSTSTINKDEIVSDTNSGLIWQEAYVSDKTWQQALKYCEDSTYAGYTDWRLPNKNELITLINEDKYDPASDFPNMPTNKAFWSSSNYMSSASAWVIFSSAGWLGTYNTQNKHDVICVRSGLCNQNQFWNGFKCVSSPCNENPCSNIMNATGECVASSWNEYKCVCSEGYFWDGEACRVSLGRICTGQTSCYDETSELETCPAEGANFFGQDAQYRNKCIPQSFTVESVNNQNIVIDSNTNLTWEVSPSTETYTWDNAANHCADLNSSNYGGKSNWRVPNLLELLTIVDNSTYNPATNSNFTNMPTSDDSLDDNLWTSNDCSFDTSRAFAFRPYNGMSNILSKTSTYKVLCVSGKELLPSTSSDFVTSSDGKTVRDNRTGLMWQKDYVAGKMWWQALKYCEDLTYAGYSDWRLPNKNELASLLDPNKSEAPYSNFPDMIADTAYDFFGSSSTGVSSTVGAWCVHFGDGPFYYYKDDFSYVRCVRSE